MKSIVPLSKPYQRLEANHAEGRGVERRKCFKKSPPDAAEQMTCRREDVTFRFACSWNFRGPRNRWETIGAESREVDLSRQETLE